MYNISTSPTKQYPNEQPYIGTHKKEVDKIVHSWDDLQDKPFGETESEIILPKTLVRSLSITSEEAPDIIDVKQNIQSGYIYRVSIDGTIYELEAKQSGVATYVGDNFEEFAESGDFEYGFTILTINNHVTRFVNTNEDHANKLIELEIAKAGVIKTIDPKFLPESISGGLIVTFSKNDEGTDYISNVSYNEVLAAILAGRYVIGLCISDEYVYYPATVSNLWNILSGISAAESENDHIEFRTGGYEDASVKLYIDDTVYYEPGLGK